MIRKKHLMASLNQQQQQNCIFGNNFLYLQNHLLTQRQQLVKQLVSQSNPTTVTEPQ